MKDIIEKILEEATKKRTTEIYRGTAKTEVLAEFKEAKQQLKAAEEAYKARHKELWDRICESLSLPQEGNYSLNHITGQVFEEIPIEEYRPEEAASE